MPDAGSEHEADVDEFARLFTRFLERMQPRGPRSSRESLRDRLRAHLGVDPEQVPVVSSSFPPYDLPNVQRAVEAWFDSFEVIGLAGSNRGHHSLGELLELAEYDRFGIGAVDYQRLQIDVDEEMDCVAFGFYLGVRGEDRYVALLRAANPQYGRSSVDLEILAVEKAAGDRFLGALPELIREHNVFRGKVVSFEGHEFGQGVGPFRLHPRPGITRADVVLPAGVLERIEREVVGIAAHRETLLAAGSTCGGACCCTARPGPGRPIPYGMSCRSCRSSRSCCWRGRASISSPRRVRWRGCCSRLSSYSRTVTWWPRRGTTPMVRRTRCCSRC